MASDRDQNEARHVEPFSAVSVWRTAGGRLLHSVRVVAGATREELDELVDLALATEARLIEQRGAK